MTLFVILFAPTSDISLQSGALAVGTRIGSVDNYISNLEGAYLETVLGNSAYRSVLSLIYYMNSTGDYLPDINGAFQEVLINGTINKVKIDSITGKKIMENHTITNWSSKISQIAKETLNVNTTIILNNASIYQTKPWSMEAELNLNFTVTSSLAEWRKGVKVTAEVNIEGLDDPYYLINTGGGYSNRIKRSTVEFNKWNLSATREHLRNGTYVHFENSGAPSFLMRFTNTLSNSSCCGIESLVNPNKIGSMDVMDSYVDYMFWGSTVTPCIELFNITNPATGAGLWDEFRFFKMDVNHVVSYNITEEYAVRSC